MATSKFSFPVVRGKGLPATLLPTPVSSVRASLRCPLASGCGPLYSVITQSHHKVAVAFHSKNTKRFHKTIFLHADSKKNPNKNK